MGTRNFQYWKLATSVIPVTFSVRKMDDGLWNILVRPILTENTEN